MIWLSLAVMRTALALPPTPGCADLLVPAAARPAYTRVMREHPGYARAYVGNLVSAWRADSGEQESWGVYDSHDQNKIFRTRDAYVRPLRSGDRLFVFDDDWNLAFAGDLIFEDRPYGWRELGVSLRVDRSPAYGDDHEINRELTRAWIAGKNAIALANPDAAERERWAREWAPEFAAWQDARKDVVTITGADFSYALAHFERAVERPARWTVRGDAIDLSFGNRPLNRGDYALFFDRSDHLIARHKMLDRDGRLHHLDERVDVAGMLEILERTARVVVIENHFFLNRRL